MKKWCIGLLLLTGCVTVPQKMNRLAIGMNKADVVAVMGTPDSTRATTKAEYLLYAVCGLPIFPCDIPRFVRLIDGKVDAYGRMGDFGSTELPQIRAALNIEEKH